MTVELLLTYGGYLRVVSNGSAMVVDVVVPYDDDVDEDCDMGARPPVAVYGSDVRTTPPLPAEYSSSLCVVPVEAVTMPPLPICN